MISLYIIFIWIVLAFIAAAFWEAYAEGTNVGAKQQCGWTIKVGKYKIKAYHFWLWYVMMPMLLILPLFVEFSKPLLGTIIAGFFIGAVAEDFLWYIVNPKYEFKKWNPKDVSCWPWWGIGKLRLPYFYWIYFLGAILSYWFLIKT